MRRKEKSAGLRVHVTLKGQQYSYFIYIYIYIYISKGFFTKLSRRIPSIHIFIKIINVKWLAYIWNGTIIRDHIYI
jgi:hypothetical protein